MSSCYNIYMSFMADERPNLKLQCNLMESFGFSMTDSCYSYSIVDNELVEREAGFNINSPTGLNGLENKTALSLNQVWYCRKSGAYFSIGYVKHGSHFVGIINIREPVLDAIHAHFEARGSSFIRFLGVIFESLRCRMALAASDISTVIADVLPVFSDPILLNTEVNFFNVIYGWRKPFFPEAALLPSDAYDLKALSLFVRYPFDDPAQRARP